MANCGPTNAFAAPLAVSTKSSADLILTRLAPTPSGSGLMRRGKGDDRGSKCLPIKEGITSACNCFFPPGPQQTVTKNHTIATGTYTTTTTSTTYSYTVRTRTVAGTSIKMFPSRFFSRLVLSLGCFAFSRILTLFRMSAS